MGRGQAAQPLLNKHLDKSTRPRGRRRYQPPQKIRGHWYRHPPTGAQGAQCTGTRPLDKASDVKSASSTRRLPLSPACARLVEARAGGSSWGQALDSPTQASALQAGKQALRPGKCSTRPCSVRSFTQSFLTYLLGPPSCRDYEGTGALMVKR